MSGKMVLSSFASHCCGNMGRYVVPKLSILGLTSPVKTYNSEFNDNIEIKYLIQSTVKDCYAMPHPVSLACGILHLECCMWNLVTKFSLVCFFSCVCSLVFSEITTGCKFLIAKFTWVWFLSCVHFCSVQ